MSSHEEDEDEAPYSPAATDASGDEHADDEPDISVNNRTLLEKESSESMASKEQQEPQQKEQAQQQFETQTQSPLAAVEVQTTTHPASEDETNVDLAMSGVQQEVDSSSTTMTKDKMSLIPTPSISPLEVDTNAVPSQEASEITNNTENIVSSASIASNGNTISNGNGSTDMPSHQSTSMTMTVERESYTPVSAMATPPPVSQNTEETPSVAAAKSSIAAMRSHKRKRRQPLDKVEQLRLQVAEDSHNSDAWLALLVEFERRADLENTRDCYEKFLKIYPTATHQWIKYIELEMDNNEFERVESLFTRCLRAVPSVELFKFYLNYVRRRNNINVGGATARAVVSQAYEYVLQHVGIDRDSSSIWTDYISFVKEGPANNTWEEQQKMDTLRRLYQRAVTIPIGNVESIWREYDQFENGLNRITAKKFLQEKSPAYMTARSALRELKTFMDNIARPVLPMVPRFDIQEMQQLDAWKEYIEWEKKNPLEYEDQTVLQTRVIYAYKIALMHMRFYPEIWFEASMYMIEIKKVDDATSLLKQGMEALPTSCLVHFVYTELEEGRKHYAEVRGAFDSLITNLDLKIQKNNLRAEDEIDELDERLKSIKPSEGEMAEIDATGQASLKKQESEITDKKKEIEKRRDDEISVLRKSMSLAWVEYMRFERRTEGVKSARQIFAKARKSSHATWHLYASSAMMEYHVSRDAKVANKIFDLGLKMFAEEAGYVYQYLDFLLNTNDITNARALFERSIKKIPGDQALTLWNRFFRHESQYGDYVAAQKLRDRMRELFPSQNNLERFTSQHIFGDLMMIYDVDLGNQGINIPQEKVEIESLTDGVEDTPTVAPITNGDSVMQSSPVSQAKPSQAPRRTGIAGRIGGPSAPPVQASGRRGGARDIGGHGVQDVIAYFISLLPPANVFNGPRYPVDQVIDVLMNADINTPPVNPGGGAKSESGGSGRRRRGGAKRRARENSTDDHEGVKRYRY